MCYWGMFNGVFYRHTELLEGIQVLVSDKKERMSLCLKQKWKLKESKDECIIGLFYEEYQVQFFRGGNGIQVGR